MRIGSMLLFPGNIGQIPRSAARWGHAAPQWLQHRRQVARACRLERESLGTVAVIDPENRTAMLRFQDGSTKTFPARIEKP